MASLGPPADKEQAIFSASAASALIRLLDLFAESGEIDSNPRFKVMPLRFTLRFVGLKSGFARLSLRHDFRFYPAEDRLQ